MSQAAKAKRRPKVILLILLLWAISATIWWMDWFRFPADESPLPTANVRPAEPLDFRTKLVATLAAESLDKTLANLADFTDVLWVQSSFRSMVFYESYEYAIRVSSKLNRVRKLLEEGRKDPPKLIPKLVKRLEAAYVGYPAAYDEMNKRIDVDPHVKEPMAYDKKTTESQACIYLLTELKSFESLPLFIRIYEQERIRGRVRFLLNNRRLGSGPSWTRNNKHALLSCPSDD